MIRIMFHGICVFFENFANYVPSASGVHRMVLVNANVDQVAFQGCPPLTVAPHRATLVLHSPFDTNGDPMPPPAGAPNSFDINQANPYTITFPASSGTPWHFEAACLPQLDETLRTARTLEPSLSVINGTDAACYVDFTYGLIQGVELTDRTAVAIATIPATEFTITGNGIATTVTFPNAATETAHVYIGNKPNSGGDSQNDYVLNYLTCANPPCPADIEIPASATGCLQQSAAGFIDLGTQDEAGPGCSNTNFP